MEACQPGSGERTLFGMEQDFSALLCLINGGGVQAQAGGLSIAEIEAAMLEPTEPEPAPSAPPSAPPAPPPAPPAPPPAPPRFRRIAAPKSQHGRAGISLESMASMLAGLSLVEAMPVPTAVPTLQAPVPAPLSHQEVPGVAARKKPAGGKEVRRIEKECDSESRRIKMYDRAQEGQGNARVRAFDERWAEGRFRAGRFCLWLLTKNNGMKREFGGRLGTGILTHIECSAAVRLLDKAAYAVPRHPNSHRLEPASAPFWALVLVLHVCRQREGFVATSDEAQRRFSFQGMVETYEQMRQCVDGDRIPEPFYEFAAESTRPELDRRLGPIKYVGKHSLGSSAKVWKRKIDCLDALLKLAGEDGLCYDVLSMRGPTQVSHERPETQGGRAKATAESGWGKKKRTRGLVLSPRAP